MLNYFLYTRKSSESEDRQILSIEGQIKELLDCAEKHNLTIIDRYEESFSAKAPGRPIFNEMMNRIERGEAAGILAWHPDRLARNSIDGGRIIYALDRGVLQDLKFPQYTFENTPQGKFMLNIFFGQSKYYVDSLSENVKRGNRLKLEKGWRPCLPPQGYLNDRTAKTIIKDPERFSLVRQMWDLMLSSNSSIAKIRQIANEEWGYRTRPHKKIGGKKLSTSLLYNIYTNPFYYGMVVCKGDLYQGAHDPMVTKAEFDQVQAILGRSLRPQPQKREFSYTGLMRCGECGCAITAEEKVNRYGSHYIYYHCTKRKGVCSQKGVELKALEQQITGFLQAIHLSDRFRDWALKHLQETHEQEVKGRQAIYDNLERGYRAVQQSLDNLTQMRCRGLLTDEEYLKNKEELLTEQIRLKENLGSIEARAKRWLELSQQAVFYANQAKNWFVDASMHEKREILSVVSSHLFLNDKILRVQAKKPFAVMAERSQNPKWWDILNAISTFFREEGSITPLFPQNSCLLPRLKAIKATVMSVSTMAEERPLASS